MSGRPRRSAVRDSITARLLSPESQALLDRLPTQLEVAARWIEQGGSLASLAMEVSKYSGGPISGADVSNYLYSAFGHELTDDRLTHARARASSKRFGQLHIDALKAMSARLGNRRQ